MGVQAGLGACMPEDLKPVSMDGMEGRQQAVTWGLRRQMARPAGPWKWATAIVMCEVGWIPAPCEVISTLLHTLGRACQAGAVALSFLQQLSVGLFVLYSVL